jgi:hypothetical protein
MRFDEFTMSLGNDHSMLAMHAKETVTFGCTVSLDGNLQRQ